MTHPFPVQPLLPVRHGDQRSVILQLYDLALNMCNLGQNWKIIGKCYDKKTK